MNVTILRKFSAYVALTKPTIVLLIVVTAIPAVLMAFAGEFDWWVFSGAVIGTMLAASAASVCNHLFEADLDRQMTRTQGRPLVRGVVAKRDATVFAILLGLGAMSVLGIMTTLTAALIAMIGILFYALFYTLVLKPNTAQNIVIGGAAGAVGPLIGWSAVTGRVIGGESLSAWLLFLIVFLWTPPHFWALAIRFRDDYRGAGIPMYPVVHGVERTKTLIVWYILALLPVLVWFYVVSECSVYFLVASLVLTLYFLMLGVSFKRGGVDAMRLFRFSCLYVLVLFTMLAVDQIIF